MIQKPSKFQPVITPKPSTSVPNKGSSIPSPTFSQPNMSPATNFRPSPAPNMSPATDFKPSPIPKTEDKKKSSGGSSNRPSPPPTPPAPNMSPATDFKPSPVTSEAIKNVLERATSPNKNATSRTSMNEALLRRQETIPSVARSERLNESYLQTALRGFSNTDAFKKRLKEELLKPAFSPFKTQVFTTNPLSERLRGEASRTEQKQRQERNTGLRKEDIGIVLKTTGANILETAEAISKPENIILGASLLATRQGRKQASESLGRIGGFIEQNPKQATTDIIGLLAPINKGKFPSQINEFKIKTPKFEEIKNFDLANPQNQFVKKTETPTGFRIETIKEKPQVFIKENPSQVTIFGERTSQKPTPISQAVEQTILRESKKPNYLLEADILKIQREAKDYFLNNKPQKTIIKIQEKKQPTQIKILDLKTQTPLRKEELGFTKIKFDKTKDAQTQLIKPRQETIIQDFLTGQSQRIKLKEVPEFFQSKQETLFTITDPKTKTSQLVKRFNILPEQQTTFIRTSYKQPVKNNKDVLVDKTQRSLKDFKDDKGRPLFALPIPILDRATISKATSTFKGFSSRTNIIPLLDDISDSRFGSSGLTSLKAASLLNVNIPKSEFSFVSSSKIGSSNVVSSVKDSKISVKPFSEIVSSSETISSTIPKTSTTTTSKTKTASSIDSLIMPKTISSTISIPKSSSSIISSTRTLLKKPITPRTTRRKLLEEEEFFTSKKRKGVKGFDVLVKEKGKEKKIATNVGLLLGKDILAKKLKSTLSSSGRFKETGKTTKNTLSTGFFARTQPLFREYKVRKGEKIPFSGLIEKRGTRLKTLEERKLIQKSKKVKGLDLFGKSQSLNNSFTSKTKKRNKRK